MVRPAPLDNITSARSIPLDYNTLTPRTPRAWRSRNSGESEYDDIQLDALHGNGQQEQEEPLLIPHASGKRKVRELDLETVLSRLPVVFLTLFALFLGSLILLSYKRPGSIEHYIGIKHSQGSQPTSSLPPELVISYENYTSFPLQPDEYRHECGKMQMWHGAYWKPPPMGIMDVPHPIEDGKSVCSSTITYMLDGKVGLLADLALMAQAATMAREVSKSSLRAE